MSNLTSISPFFIVSKIKDSVDFYVSNLGFEVLYMGPEGDPFFAMVGREQISIMLKAIAPDIQPLPNPARHEWAAWDAYIFTKDPDTLFEEFSSSGITLRRSLQDDNDGLLGFEVTDADGYVLFFGRPKS